MKHGPKAACLGGVLAVSLGVTGAAAQYALDANPSVSGGRNPHRAGPAVQREIYSVNRATGTMVYNRANAFNDPTYSIYQRSAFSLFDEPVAAGVSTAAALEAPRQASPAQSPGISETYTPPRDGRDATPPRRVAVSPVDRIAPTVQSGPAPSPTERDAPLSQPAYSVADRPLRSPGAESPRARTYSVFGD